MLDELAQTISRHRINLRTGTAVPRLTLIAADTLPPATAVMWDPLIPPSLAAKSVCLD